MKIYNHIDEFSGIDNPVVTIGTFDGVHVGHQKILQRVQEIAKKNQGESVLLTFFPHPRMVLFPEQNDIRLINTLDEKVGLLARTGIDHMIIHPFTPEFSKTTSLEFVRELLVKKIGAKKLVIGYDHHFGKNREGSFEHLKEFSHLYGFDVEEIPAQDVDHIHVSSTKIRKAIGRGDIDTANRYLGYDFLLKGTVVEGNKLGRTLGFRTANIYVEEKYKLIPDHGVYAVKVDILGQSFNGMLNIGTRPTVQGRDRSIEVHIFDFDREVYNETIGIAFVDRIRDEVAFNGLDELKEQLNKDKTAALNILT